MKKEHSIFVNGGVLQRQQLASSRTPLTPFAPDPPTVSCVPLSRNLSPAGTHPLPMSAGAHASQRQLLPFCRTSVLLLYRYEGALMQQIIFSDPDNDLLFLYLWMSIRRRTYF